MEEEQMVSPEEEGQLVTPVKAAKTSKSSLVRKGSAGSLSSLKKSSSGSLETPAKKHVRLSALEKLSLCKAVRERMEAGESSWAAVRAESLKQHVHTRTGLRIWQDRDYWQEWTEKFQPGKHGRRKQGQRTSMSKLAARGRGCNKPGSRGYLGRQQHMRSLVLQVKAWADAETVRGKSLARLDLLMRLLELLRLAVKAGEQNAESHLSVQ